MWLCSLFLVFICVSQVLSEPRSNIVGGRSATTSRYPYQVSLRKKNRHYCGGSIISSNIVLTAAHCMYNKHNISILSVVAGSDFQYTSGGDTYGVQSIIIHEKYDRISPGNDIALIRLDRPIEYSQNVRRIRLARTDPSPGEIATITGWGLTTTEGKVMRDQMNSLKVKIISLDTCRTYEPIDPNVLRLKVTDSSICTLNGPGEGVCQGDSGGPLVVGDEQVGLVSFVADKCAIRKPDVYTSVAAYRKWIFENSGV